MGWSDISCVHCVIARTKTRSKNSSSGETCSVSRRAVVSRAPRSLTGGDRRSSRDRPCPAVSAIARAGEAAADYQAWPVPQCGHATEVETAASKTMPQPHVYWARSIGPPDSRARRSCGWSIGDRRRVRGGRGPRHGVRAAVGTAVDEAALGADSHGVQVLLVLKDAPPSKRFLCLLSESLPRYLRIDSLAPGRAGAAAILSAAWIPPASARFASSSRSRPPSCCPARWCYTSVSASSEAKTPSQLLTRPAAGRSYKLDGQGRGRLDPPSRRRDRSSASATATAAPRSR